MIDRFTNERTGRENLVRQLHFQSVVAGIPGLVEALADVGELEEVRRGHTIIEQGDDSSDVYFIVTGSFNVIVNGKHINRRWPGQHVGEMAAISPQRRSATVTAAEDAIVLKVSEPALSELGQRFAGLWRNIAQELARRLAERNALIRPPNETIRVFVISSQEGLPIARELQSAFADDPFLTIVWADGVFRVTNYTLESLEDELDKSDFAIAIAHPDDTTQVRDEEWPTPRDNVIFELGFFMGRLGRQRAILLEPQFGERPKLPSDLAGVTTIRYSYEQGGEVKALMAPACNKLREHISRLGRNI